MELEHIKISDLCGSILSCEKEMQMMYGALALYMSLEESEEKGSNVSEVLSRFTLVRFPTFAGQKPSKRDPKKKIRINIERPTDIFRVYGVYIPKIKLELSSEIKTVYEFANSYIELDENIDKYMVLSTCLCKILLPLMSEDDIPCAKFTRKFLSTFDIGAWISSYEHVSQYYSYDLEKSEDLYNVGFKISKHPIKRRNRLSEDVMYCYVFETFEQYMQFDPSGDNFRLVIPIKDICREGDIPLSLAHYIRKKPTNDKFSATCCIIGSYADLKISFHVHDGEILNISPVHDCIMSWRIYMKILRTFDHASF